MLLFWFKLYFYHVTRQLAEFGVKWTPLVAWEGAQPLFLAYFGLCPRMPSFRPDHTSFYPQNTINILLLCCSLVLDVETEVWRGSDFDPFWHPSPLVLVFFKGNDKKCTSHQPLGVFTPILLQCLFITRAPKHQKSCNLVQWLIWCGHLAVRSRVHAAAHCAWAPWRAIFKLQCYEKLATTATIQH